MRLLTDALHAYGKAVKQALPLLIIVTIILDALLLQSIDRAPSMDIGF